MEEIIQISPAYDNRSPDPRKNYGVHGVDMRFILKGYFGAVQFVLFTNWMLPSVQSEFGNMGLSSSPLPADLGYHSPKPMYEGQLPTSESCEYLDGRPCYYNGSTSSAELVWLRLLSEGDKGVWDALEKYYHETFDRNGETE